MKTRPSVTPKPPLAFTALNSTFLKSVTEEPLLSSSSEPQTSSGTTEIELSKTSKVFQGIRIPGVLSGSAWSTGSGDSDTHNMFRPSMGSLSMGSDSTLVSLSNPSFSPNTEPLMGLTNVRETSTVMPQEAETETKWLYFSEITFKTPPVSMTTTSTTSISVSP